MCRDHLINKTNINLLVAVEQMSEDHHSNEDSSPEDHDWSSGDESITVVINPD